MKVRPELRKQVDFSKEMMAILGPRESKEQEQKELQRALAQPEPEPFEVPLSLSVAESEAPSRESGGGDGPDGPDSQEARKGACVWLCVQEPMGISSKAPFRTLADDKADKVEKMIGSGSGKHRQVDEDSDDEKQKARDEDLNDE